MKEMILYMIQYAKDAVKGFSKGYYIFCAITLIIAGAGLSNALLFLSVGHGLSGMSDMVPWGIYISGLAFFIGLSAGATLVGLLIHGFGREDYHPIGTIAIICALLSIFAAMTCVMLDVGNPFRAMKIPFLLRNPTSMFFISSTSYMGFMALLSAELYFTIKYTIGTATDLDKKIGKMLGIIAVPYALIVVHSFTGTIFGVVKAREMWNTPLLPVHFITSALASGFALVVLITLISSKIQKKHLVSMRTYNHMGTMLFFFVVATFYLDFFDHLIVRYNQTIEGMETWHLLTGRYLPLFALNMGGLFFSMVLLGFKKGRTPGGLFVATISIILSIGAYRINLITIGQLVPLYEELGELQYILTFKEITMFIGLVSLLIFLYGFLSKIIPLEKPYDPERAE